MAQVYKVLGQSAPAATTDTNIYTVPAATETVVSTIVIANRSSTSSSFRIAVRPAGATLANQHYIAYDIPVSGNDSTTLTIGITLAATDVVTVRSSSTNLSFNLFGSEIS
jgi:glucose-6-phosphate dehydrogenase assembly protein OpcA